jgi:ABC-type transport system involved in multi-copper enzyme maturation permease subunit
MKRLLKIEILKNLAYRPFKIFSIIYLFSIIVVALIGFAELNFGVSAKFKLKDLGIYNFPNIWHFTAYIVSLLKLFLAAIVVFSISQEFSNRMFKQNIIDGLSKWEFLKSKLLTIGVFSTLSTLFVAIISLLLGLKNSDPYASYEFLSEFFFLGLYFVKIFLFLVLFLFLTILFRNSIFPFLTFFIFWIIEGIFSIICIILESQSLIPHWLANIYQYLPLFTISKIVEAPFGRIEPNVTGVGDSLFSISKDIDIPWLHLSLGIGYIILFIFSSFKILSKRDW